MEFQRRINPTQVIRWGIIALTLLLSLTPAYLGSQRVFRLVSLAALGTVSIALFIPRPYLGLYGVLIGGMLVPFQLSTGTQTGVNLAMIFTAGLLGLWLVDVLVFQKDVNLDLSPPMLAGLAIILSALLSFVAGQANLLPGEPASTKSQLGGLAIFLFSVGIFMFTAHQIKKVDHLRWAVWLFIIIGGIYIADRLVPGLGQYTGRVVQRGASGSMLWTWLVSLSLAQALFNSDLKPGVRAFLLLLVVSSFQINLFRSSGHWTSGWLPALFASVAVIWAGAPRYSLGAYLTGGLILLLNTEKLREFVLGGDNTYSLETRLEAWSNVLNLVKASPIFGLGPSNYYNYTLLEPIRGWYTNFSSHNNYVDILGQMGLMGLAAFTWFMGSMVSLSWQLLGAFKSGFERGYVIGVFGGVLGTIIAALLGDWVLPFVYNVGFDGYRSSVLAWIFMGGLIALKRMQPEAAKVQ